MNHRWHVRAHPYGVTRDGRSLATAGPPRSTSMSHSSPSAVADWCSWHSGILNAGNSEQTLQHQQGLIRPAMHTTVPHENIMPMEIHSKVHREVVRLADIAVPEPKISGITFERCLILGPAVLAMTGEGTISGCTFDSEADALLWEIPAERRLIVGAIEAEACNFIDCRFSMVGFAGPADFVKMFREGVQ